MMYTLCDVHIVYMCDVHIVHMCTLMVNQGAQSFSWILTGLFTLKSHCNEHVWCTHCVHVHIGGQLGCTIICTNTHRIVHIRVAMPWTCEQCRRTACTSKCAPSTPVHTCSPSTPVHCGALSFLCAPRAEMCSRVRRKILLCRNAAKRKLVQNCTKFDLQNRTGQVQNWGASWGTIQHVALQPYKASQIITRNVTTKMPRGTFEWKCQNWLLHIKLLLVVKTKAAPAAATTLISQFLQPSMQ